MTGYLVRETNECVTKEFPNKGSESPYKNSKYNLWKVVGSRVQWRGVHQPTVAHLDAMDAHLGATYEHSYGSLILR